MGLWESENTGGVEALKIITITDPALNAAVTTSIVDTYNGVVITLTGVGNAQTIQNPTDITVSKEFIVANNDTSMNVIIVNSVAIATGEAQKFFWDGSAWLILVAGGGGKDIIEIQVFS